MPEIPELKVDFEQVVSNLTSSYMLSDNLQEKEPVIIPGTEETIASLPKVRELSNEEPKKVIPVVVIPVGSIDAKGFFDALKSAGKRPNAKGVPMFTNIATQRQDERDAVQAYIGWNSRLPHGTNLDKARTQANSELRSYVGKEYSRSSKPTIAGYVAGMPNETRKRVENLQGRLNKAIDDFSQYEAISKDESQPRGTRQHNMGLAAVERDRIRSINNDLRQMGFQYDNETKDTTRVFRRA